MDIRAFASISVIDSALRRWYTNELYVSQAMLILVVTRTRRRPHGRDATAYSSRTFSIMLSGWIHNDSLVVGSGGPSIRLDELLLCSTVAIMRSNHRRLSSNVECCRCTVVALLLTAFFEARIVWKIVLRVSTTVRSRICKLLAQSWQRLFTSASMIGVL